MKPIAKGTDEILPGDEQTDYATDDGERHVGDDQRGVGEELNAVYSRMKTSRMVAARQRQRPWHVAGSRAPLPQPGSRPASSLRF